jgi:hypothetical protein
MIRKLLQAVLCLVLCPLLVAQQPPAPAVTSDTPQSLAPAPATDASHALPEFVTIPKNTEIELITLEAVSSATATKGQLVRLAVAEDVRVEGLVVIPKGTFATGEVTHLRKGVPGKNDGSIRLSPITLTLGNGKRTKLWESAYGEDDCANVGPCWVLWTLFWPIGLVGMAVHGTENRDDESQKPKGKDVTIDDCNRFSAYLAHRIALRTIDLQAVKHALDDTAPCKSAPPIKAAAVAP